LTEEQQAKFKQDIGRQEMNDEGEPIIEDLENTSANAGMQSSHSTSSKSASSIDEQTPMAAEVVDLVRCEGHLCSEMEDEKDEPVSCKRPRIPGAYPISTDAFKVSEFALDEHIGRMKQVATATYAGARESANMSEDLCKYLGKECIEGSEGLQDKLSNLSDQLRFHAKALQETVQELLLVGAEGQYLSLREAIRRDNSSIWMSAMIPELRRTPENHYPQHVAPERTTILTRPHVRPVSGAFSSCSAVTAMGVLHCSSDSSNAAVRDDGVTAKPRRQRSRTDTQKERPRVRPVRKDFTPARVRALSCAAKYKQAETKARELLSWASSAKKRVTAEHVVQVLNFWPFMRNTKRTNVMPKGTTFVQSEMLGVVRIRMYAKHVISAKTKAYPAVTKLLCQFIYDNPPNLLPPGTKFPFTTICINKDYSAKRHRDNNNSGVTAVVAMGNYTGGRLRHWPNDPGPKAVPDVMELDARDMEVADVREQPKLVDSTKAHEVEHFDGQRFSIVYFTTSSRHNVEQSVRRTARTTYKIQFPEKGAVEKLESLLHS